MKLSIIIQKLLKTCFLFIIVGIFSSLVSTNGEGNQTVDADNPVQVFILLGQSNMLGAGKVKGGDGSLEHAVKQKNLYSYLIDKDGNWSERKDVRNVRVMGSGTGAMRQFNNEWMSVKGGRIGPEFGIGHEIGNYMNKPVMILKSCIGNRALGWDLLPLSLIHI